MSTVCQFTAYRYRTCVLAVLITQAMLLPSVAQKAPAPPKYDVQTESKAKGSIQEIKLPAAGNAKESVHLLIKETKEATEVIDITLCPKSFLDDMGMTFNKGDEVSLTVSKVKQEGSPDLILARDVLRGEDRLILRDEKGVPVWNWKR